MRNRTVKDFLIEMSIREIWTQTHFAELAYKHVDPKAISGTAAVFSSIYSFLSHCTMVSKMLVVKDREIPPNSIGGMLNISKSSIIHNRRFRNHLEHYDERLKKWIQEKGTNSVIGTYNIGPKSMIGIPNMIFVSHYDPSDHTFTFVNEDFNLDILYQDVQRVKSIADAWVQAMQFGKIKPPFG